MAIRPKPTTIYREEYRGHKQTTRQTFDPEQFAQWQRNWAKYKADGSTYLGATTATFYVGHVEWRRV